ncbi:MAG: hypothetical protein EI684_13980 [Candidatus Viridilinea halotolerans]|uniref:DUF1819 family protein n=1 Tax=Candidatus Viridilinea halotolerans TaxID=2491704 RepID=A0A426TWV2_9CHLR|nr:MAG: hypothetical protein EI684_13980 [Candidatus Viridilinea halotolerans]
MEIASLPLSGRLVGISERPVGTHLSRTMMLADLRRLLADLPVDAAAGVYRTAVVDENILLKPTASTRKISFTRLRDLYALDPTVLLFRVLREIWADDVEAQPLLALLCALARDLLLRSSAEMILALPVGEHVTPQQLTQVVSMAFPERYSLVSLATAGKNIASSWQQAGHLVGKLKKVRVQAHCRPNAVVYALLLGYLQGGRGAALFQTLWARVLDMPLHAIHAQAQIAAQRGWLEYRRAGDVVEVEFRHLLGTPAG